MDFEIIGTQLKKYHGKDTHVIIDNNITSISDFAFSGCHELESIILPTSIKELGDQVFYDCSSLKEVILPDSITYMGEGIFNRCKSLRKAKLPSSLTSLGKIDFFQCESLKEVILPLNLKRIGRSCFEQCIALEVVDLPKTLEVLGDNVFDDCLSLKEIILPTTLKTIGNNTFFHCPQLALIHLPSSLEMIGVGAFETSGPLTLISHTSLMIESKMCENNWNMNWNIGRNKRYNGHNEDNYQLYNSYLPHVDFKQWKPHALIVLLTNFLETLPMHNEQTYNLYKLQLQQHLSEVIEKCILEERYHALHQGLEKGCIMDIDIEPYFDLIKNKEEKVKFMNNKQATSNIDDLFDLL